MNKTCVYCDNHNQLDNPIKIWKETNEMVCYDCRKSLLEQEFEEEKPKKGGNGGYNYL